MLLFVLVVNGISIHSGSGYRVHKVFGLKPGIYPAVPICPNPTPKTPNCVSSDVRNFAMQWVHDTDMDDLADLWDDGKMPLSYQLINSLLKYLRYDDAGSLQRFTGLANDLKDHSGKNFGVICEALVHNIVVLQSSLKLYPIAATVGLTSSIKLYRGEKFAPLVKELSVLMPGQDFILPTFMSTSLVEDVAYRFAPAMNPVILEVTVPRDKLPYFPYTYFGEDIDLARTTTIQETELLLDLGTVLTLVSKELRPKVTFSTYSMFGEIVSGALLNVTVFHLTFKRNSRIASRTSLRSQVVAKFNIAETSKRDLAKAQHDEADRAAKRRKL